MFPNFSTKLIKFKEKTFFSKKSLKELDDAVQCDQIGQNIAVLATF
jgi:hypothetical protein